MIFELILICHCCWCLYVFLLAFAAVDVLLALFSLSTPNQFPLSAPQKCALIPHSTVQFSSKEGIDIDSKWYGYNTARMTRRTKSGIKIEIGVEKRKKSTEENTMLSNVSPIHQLFITWHKSWSTRKSVCVEWKWQWQRIQWECFVKTRIKFVTHSYRPIDRQTNESYQMFGEARLAKRTWHMCHTHTNTQNQLYHSTYIY